MDQPAAKDDHGGAEWSYIGQMFRNRMMVGIFIGQYCINAVTYFFITWFPVYPVQACGMSIPGRVCRLAAGDPRISWRHFGLAAVSYPVIVGEIKRLVLVK